MSDIPQNQGWTLDKHIPVAAIISGAAFIIMQTIFLTMWLTNLSNRVSFAEDFIKASQPQASQIAVIQEKVTTLQATVTRLEEWLRHNVPTK